MTQSKRSLAAEKVLELLRPKAATWTDEALPLPVRLQLLREELAKVQQEKQRTRPERIARPR